MARIIERRESYEVVRNDGSSKSFPFDDNASRRAVSARMTRKQALQSAKAFAGKGHTMEKASDAKPSK